MSQVNCVRHSVKRLQYVPHDLSLELDAAVSLMVGAAAAAAQRDAYVWELCYLRGTWVPYPQDTCRLLEGADDAPCLLVARKHDSPIALARGSCSSRAIEIARPRRVFRTRGSLSWHIARVTGPQKPCHPASMDTMFWFK
jgi:hypothetical protein